MKETFKLEKSDNQSSYKNRFFPDVAFSSTKKNKITFEDKRLTGHLSTYQKLCFGIGGLPYQLTSNAIGLFISTFLLEIAGLRPSDLSIILLYGKVWDAFTDPLVGYACSKTNTKFGRLRPWIIFPVPFAVFCYMMIWYVPDIEKEYKTLWYLIFYCSFNLFLSCLHVPYTSLTMYLTHNQKERDSATGFRMTLELFGVLLSALIQGTMITIYGSKVSCENSQTFEAFNTSSGYKVQNSISYSSNLTFEYENDLTNITTKLPKHYNKLAEGYLISAGVVGLIYFVSCLTTFLETEEVKDVITDKDNHFISSITTVLKSKSYLTLLVAFMFNSLAGQLLSTNIALYCKYTINGKDQYQLIIITLLASTIFSIPAWQIAMTKFGKKKTYAVGLISFVPNLIPLLFITDQIWLMYVMSISSGISMASHFLLPWSMLPDVIDEYLIKNGERKEAIFYSFYVFFTKFSSGISVGVSSLFLEYSGYKDCPNGCCIQPESVKWMLRLLVVPAPIIFIMISIFSLYIHPIDEKVRIKNKETLINIRSKSIDVLTNLTTF